jgi:chitodextrinase
VVTDTVAEITGLTAYGAYSMTLRARDAAGNKSDTSNALIVRTLDVHPPTAPTGLVAWNITDSTLSLGWMASEDNVSVLQYDVYSNGLLAESTADTSIDFTGLNPLTEFLITVIARDPAGNPSPASTALYIVTPDTREPDAPNGLISDKIKHNSFRLIWNTPWDNVGVSEYMVYRNDMLVSTVSDTMAFITGLKANTAYLMTVRAEDASGNVSEMSDTLEVTTDFPGADATITLFPNPVTDNTLNIDLGSENCTETLVEILDMEGNLMVKQMVDGTNRLITFTVDDLSPGIYILHVRCNGNAYSKKLMIGAIY